MGTSAVYHPQGREVMSVRIISLEKINIHGGSSSEIRGLVSADMFQHFSGFEPVDHNECVAQIKCGHHHDIECKIVEQRQGAQQPVAMIEFIEIAEGRNIGQDSSMGLGGPFRPAGGPGGIDDTDNIIILGFRLTF